MGGILHIAYKLLVNDRAKYAALLVGISFVVFLMIEMTSLFAALGGGWWNAAGGDISVGTAAAAAH